MRAVTKPDENRCRYIERGASPGSVEGAEAWRWSSLRWFPAPSRRRCRRSRCTVPRHAAGQGRERGDRRHRSGRHSGVGRSRSTRRFIGVDSGDGPGLGSGVQPATAGTAANRRAGGRGRNYLDCPKRVYIYGCPLFPAPPLANFGLIRGFVTCSLCGCAAFRVSFAPESRKENPRAEVVNHCKRIVQKSFRQSSQRLPCAGKRRPRVTYPRRS